MPVPLDYAAHEPPMPIRCVRAVARVLRTQWRGLLMFLILGGIILAWLHGPTSADIRLDTGDLRYRYCGIPITIDRTPGPQRSKLLELAKGSTVLVPRWERCARFPLPTSNNTPFMCQGFYFRAVPWIDEDRALARLMLEDVVSYITQTHAERGLPRSSMLLSGFLSDRSFGGLWVLRPDWRDDDKVKRYANLNHHSLTTAPAH